MLTRSCSHAPHTNTQDLYTTVSLVMGLLTIGIEGNGYPEEGEHEELYGVITVITAIMGLGTILMCVTIQTQLGFFALDEIAYFTERFAPWLLVPVTTFLIATAGCLVSLVLRYYAEYGSNVLYAASSAGGVFFILCIYMHVKVRQCNVGAPSHLCCNARPIPDSPPHTRWCPWLSCRPPNCSRTLPADPDSSWGTGRPVHAKRSREAPSIQLREM